jgi:heme/copper-type cytochrome/quinol oxidase subunit 3
MSSFDTARPLETGRRRSALPNGIWGMAIFLATETFVFGVLIGSTFYLRFRVGAWPPHGIARPDWIAPVVLTAVLVAAGLPLQLAYRAARDGQRLAAWWRLLTAFALQTGYLAWQLHLFVDQLRAVPPQQSAYGSVTATLLGADHFHVFVGLLLDVWMLLRLATGLTRYRLVGLQATVFYWHVVNAITVLVVLTQLSPYA